MNATVTAAAIGVGGSVIVALAAFWASVRNTKKTTDLTHRALELTERGQVADRYTRAIEQIGSDKSLPVRIGGIYALERVAHDSTRDHRTVMEVLTAYIREHSGKQWQRAEAAAEPPERTMPPDIQAAVTVIGRRDHKNDRQPINLADAELIRAYLASAYLAGANLHHADLTYAVLDSADLTGAELNHAKLRDARLRDAKLPDATLARAHLTGADLGCADLSRANLTGADLTRAYLGNANLTGANLSSATWPEGVPVPEGWLRDSGSGQLRRANEDAGDVAN